MTTAAKLTKDPDSVLRGRHHVLFALGTALALTLLVTSFLQSSMGLAAIDEIRDQNTQMDSVDRLLLHLVDAETGVRGYLLTGEAVYLEPYEAATARLPEVIDEVRETFADQATDRERVTTLLALVDAKLETMSGAVARQAMEGAKNVDIADRVLMEESRQHIGRLRAELGAQERAKLAQSKSRFRLSRALGIVLAACTMLLMLALFTSIRRELVLRERLATMMASENERLERQVAIRTSELSDLARYVNNAREAEKERLARELHDELGALLTAAKLDTGWMRRRLPDDLRRDWQARLDRLESSLSAGIALKRRIIDDLRPPLLKELGLVEAMRAMCDDFATGNDFECDAELPSSAAAINEERSLAIYRIAQEALTNVRKYAEATRVELSLSCDDGIACLTVRDNGKGFDLQAVSSTRHGIAGMRQRVQTYAGHFTVESVPGSGACIRAEIPLHD